ncbi:Riboflavin synthase eubacterial/eukaryotic [Helicobacter bizzozeronii CCUG 35545]|nr:Riboflavin synthase eubacterial/eukaryotic [Helicobacter bizzozeronii CCUG 35545]
MFSGLIYQVAQVKSLKGDLLEIKSDYVPKIGDSIAINGACLSVVALNSQGFSLQLSQHTQESIALENYQQGAWVNLEPALLANSRLDGHLVQGHVDGIGIITQIKPVANQISVQIQAPLDILRLCIPKGSIAIDGVSLTLASVGADTLELVIIPHTFKNTLFCTYTQGRRVNMESDMLVRSVAHLLAKQAPSPTWSELDMLVMGY